MAIEAVGFKGLDEEVVPEPSQKKQKVEECMVDEGQAASSDQGLTIEKFLEQVKVSKPVMAAVMEELGGGLDSDLEDFGMVLEAELEEALVAVKLDGKGIPPMQKGQ